VLVQPAPPSHRLAAASTPLEDLHTRWVVCTPWPHVTEHEVPASAQLYVSQAGRLQLASVGAQPPSHRLAAASAPLEDLHTRWVVCTPWPHVTVHEVAPLKQLYSMDSTAVDGGAVDGSGVAQGESSHSSKSAGLGSVQLPSATTKVNRVPSVPLSAPTPPTTLVVFNEVPEVNVATQRAVVRVWTPGPQLAEQNDHSEEIQP
jgi:hypothetical protein